VTIQIDHEAFDRATRLVAGIAAGHRKEHRHLQADVADLLSAGWNGVASEQRGQGWQGGAAGWTTFSTGSACRT
jgi:hypothetical protein